jgi:hypothetical protein
MGCGAAEASSSAFLLYVAGDVGRVNLGASWFAASVWGGVAGSRYQNGAIPVHCSQGRCWRFCLIVVVSSLVRACQVELENVALQMQRRSFVNDCRDLREQQWAYSCAFPTMYCGTNRCCTVCLEWLAFDNVCLC